MSKEEVLFHALRLSSQDRWEISNACLAENKLGDMLKAMRDMHSKIGEFVGEIVLKKAAFEAVKRHVSRQQDLLGVDVFIENEKLLLRGTTVIRSE